MNDQTAPQAAATEAPTQIATEALSVLKTSSNESPGYKTTEFWAHALITAGLVLAAAAGALPAKWAAGCVTASGVAYAISRGLSKQGNSN